MFEVVGCRFKHWNPEPVFRIEQLQKGELWMAMHRRHAGMVVGDVTFYRKFKGDCSVEGVICTLDEQYTQTLLHCLDPEVGHQYFCFITP